MILTRLLAVLILIAGIVTLPFPIAIGVPLIMVGLGLFATTSPMLLIWFRKLRKKYRSLDRVVQTAEDHVPLMISNELHKSDPECEDEATSGMSADEQD